MVRYKFMQIKLSALQKFKYPIKKSDDYVKLYLQFVN